MKILLLISSLENGGAESHVCSLAKALATEGHSVDIASYYGRLVPSLLSLGITHFDIRLDSRAPWSVLKAYRQLKKLIANGKYDVVHAHSRIAAFLASQVLKRSHTPLIVTAHAHFNTNILYRHLSRWGDLTISVSEDLKQYLCENYACVPSMIKVIPNGIDSEIFYPAQNSLPPCKRIVFLSRLDRDCSQIAFLLCEISSQLNKIFPSIEIVIGGGGEALNDLRKAAHSADPNARTIRLLGHVNDPRDLLVSASLFVGVSRAALEAMACAIPIILAGNEGYLGLIDSKSVHKASLENFCCRGYSKASADKLFSDIYAFFSMSEEKQRTIGYELSKHVSAHYGIKKMSSSTLDVYREAICQRQFDLSDKKALFCGYYGFGNIGDDAMLREAIAIAKHTHGQYSVCAMTKNGRRDAHIFGIRCIKRSSPYAVIKEIISSDLLIFGGGTLLQDISSFRSLLYYALVLKIAQKRGVRTELWSNGLNSSRFALSDKILRSVLLGCDRLGLRDERSVILAKRLVKEQRAERIILEKDLALNVTSAKRDRISYLRHKYLLDGAELVIVSVKNIPQGYMKIFNEWLCLLKAEGRKLLFIPMFPREDIALTKRMSRELGGTVAYGLDASDIVGLAASASLICSARLHLLVFAAKTQTPFIGFGDDEKIESFCRENGGVFFTDLYSKKAFHI